MEKKVDGVSKVVYARHCSSLAGELRKGHCSGKYHHWMSLFLIHDLKVIHSEPVNGGQVKPRESLRLQDFSDSAIWWTAEAVATSKDSS